MLAEPVTYEVKIGTKGEWEKFVLEPQTIRRHSWKYGKPNQNRSPEFQVRYEGDPEKRARPVTPIATPNAKLGSLYVFNRDKQDRQVYLYTPVSSVSRR
jgi:hypothetical protein